MIGTIVKAISGFYYVEAEGTVYECKAKGAFKKKGLTPLVGDEVEFDEGACFITKLLPRINSFDRPPVANAKSILVVMAGADPAPSFEILDRFIVSAEDAGAEVMLCINKCDIAPAEIIEKFKTIYGPIYPIFFVSGTKEEGLEDLKKALHGRQLALAGPSGVGKSTLTNLLLGREESEVGEISQKSLRGKNTTRHTELFQGDGFKIFDTPGFTSFDAVLEDETLLAEHFLEFVPYLGECRFDDCRHLKEPGCAVRQALENGKISESRYKSYETIYNKILEDRRY